MDQSMLAGTRMLTVAVAAEMVYQLVGSNMSSPQTAELNAHSRSATLMKWVKLGLVQGAVITAVAAWIAKSSGQKAWPVLTGAGLAAGMMWASYQHALTSGLASGEPGTEQY